MPFLFVILLGCIEIAWVVKFPMPTIPLVRVLWASGPPYSTNPDAGEAWWLA